MQAKPIFVRKLEISVALTRLKDCANDRSSTNLRNRVAMSKASKYLGQLNSAQYNDVKVKHEPGSLWADNSLRLWSTRLPERKMHRMLITASYQQQHERIAKAGRHKRKNSVE
jgi:hypothetical protein